MLTVIISSKYQITIPKEVRKSLGLKKGDVIVFIPTDGRYVLSAIKVPDDPLSAIDGILADLNVDAVEAKHLAHKLCAVKRMKELESA